MNIVRWRPFAELDPWFNEEGQSLFYPRGGFTPAIDVYQTNESVIVETPLAGVAPEKVNISVENDVLTIEGTMERKTEVDEKHYYRKEIRMGSFHRAIALPAAVNGDKAQATFENGILKIDIPKEERAKPKTIKVSVTKKP